MSGMQNPPPFEEPLEDYAVDGYHPTRLGDVFNERYRVVRKLGWGGYSTVWLAQDSRLQCHVALKILTGAATNQRNLDELGYLRRVRDKDPSHAGHRHVLQLMNYFYLRGPHGTHLCIVTEVLGPNISALAKWYHDRRLPTSLVKDITRQLLLGLDYLHDYCGIIHTDLKNDNFLVTLDNVEETVHNALQATRPVVYPTIQRKGAQPITYVVSQPIYPIVPNDGTAPITIKIADFGVSCWRDKVAQHFTDLIQSPALRAPEVLIGAGWDASCDVWSIGCDVFEMVTDSWFFADGLRPASHAANMIVWFGDFPPDLVAKAKYSARYLKPDGSFVFDIEKDKSSLEARVSDAKTGLGTEEDALFVSFLRSAMQLDPNRRGRPRELAKHPWLVGKS